VRDLCESVLNWGKERAMESTNVRLGRKEEREGREVGSGGENEGKRGLHFVIPLEI